MNAKGNVRRLPQRRLTHRRAQDTQRERTKDLPLSYLLGYERSGNASEIVAVQQIGLTILAKGNDKKF